MLDRLFEPIGKEKLIARCSGRMNSKKLELHNRHGKPVDVMYVDGDDVICKKNGYTMVLSLNYVSSNLGWLSTVETVDLYNAVDDVCGVYLVDIEGRKASLVSKKLCEPAYFGYYTIDKSKVVAKLIKGDKWRIEWV